VGMEWVVRGVCVLYCALLSLVVGSRWLELVFD
jgi:hypothetical protein